jgi:hypothetical protein
MLASLLDPKGIHKPASTNLDSLAALSARARILV